MSRLRDSARQQAGAWLVFIVIVVLGTWFPITWIFVKQTATSRSTTEAETAALAHCLIQE